MLPFMPKVQSYADLYVAQMLVDELEHAGIQARLRNTDLVGMVPGVPFTTAYCEVWVDDPELLDDAARVVQQFEQQRSAQPEAPADDESIGPMAEEQAPRGGMSRAVKTAGAVMLVLFVVLVGMSWCMQPPTDQRPVPRPGSGRPF